MTTLALLVAAIALSVLAGMRIQLRLDARRTSQRHAVRFEPFVDEPSAVPFSLRSRAPTREIPRNGASR